jgi:uncharacterized membrane protein required for colicin V production
VDIGEFITSLNTFDLLVVFVLGAMFILGFIQGTIRRLMGIASILFSFLVAANVREPLGEFLAANWTHLRPEYATMVGFGTIFVATAITFTIAIQAFYKKAPLFEKYTVVDEVLGGVLGVLQGVLLLAITVIILDSVFEIPGVPRTNTELPFLRELHDAYDPSITAGILRDRAIPVLFAILGPFIPDTLRQLFPGTGA